MTVAVAVAVADLNANQTNTVLSTADDIKLAAASVAKPNSFTFVANFDGTRNSLRDPSLSGTRFGGAESVDPGLPARK